MHAGIFRWCLSPLRLWRTIVLTCGASFAAARIGSESFVVFCVAFACAFVFSGHERREWIVMPAHSQAGDILARISLVFMATIAF